jgi:hypothetical protein
MQPPSLGPASPQFDRDPPKSSKAIWVIVSVVGGASLLGLVCVAGLVAVVLRAAHRGEGPLAGLAAGAWQTYTSDEGRYSVELPGRPKTRTETKPTPLGPIVVKFTYAEATPESVFMVNHCDLPVARATDDPRAIFDDGCAEAMASSQGKQQSSKDVTFEGFPGREVIFNGTQRGRSFRCHTRLLLVGRRLYQTMWIGSGEEPAADVERFLASFKLISPPKADKPAKAEKPKPSPRPPVAAEKPAKPPIAAEKPAKPPAERPPAEKPGPEKLEPKKPGLDDLATRQQIYREATLMRRHIEMLEKQRADRVAQGRDAGFLDSSLQRVREQQDQHYASVCRRRGITREQLDAIISEGDAAGWKR